ncbi:MAG: LLM class F420-dependent oxidoreductase [Chloroflexi bacterium]|nr:LLM class F420-dependent oxidoreductase [Chloroflexota bacterium]
MRIGLNYGGVASIEARIQSVDEHVQRVVDAEEDGFDSIWIAQIFGADALTVIALAGPRTKRIEMGTGVVPTYPRHPFVLAQQALTVQAAAGGRLTLGIGLSHQPVIEGMWGLSYDKPARHMREYLSVLRPLVEEGTVAFSGDVFRVQGALQVPGAQPFPILIAGLAPMMLRIAGELADGTVTWMTGPKTIETHIVPRISAAAEAAGRPAPRIGVALPVAVTDDATAARKQAAQEFQMYGFLPNYRRMLDIEGAQGPEDVAVIGTEAEVESQIRAIAAAGTTDFIAALFPTDGDPDASMTRTRALLKSLVGKV